MIVSEITIVGAEGIEIPDVEVDETFTLEAVVRVFSVERDQVDVSSASGFATLPGGLRLKGVVVKDWPKPAPLPGDYWESAE